MVRYKVQMRMKIAVLAYFTIYLLSFKSSKGTKSTRKRVYMIMSHKQVTCQDMSQSGSDNNKQTMCVSYTQIEFGPWHMMSNNVAF